MVYLTIFYLAIIMKPGTHLILASFFIYIFVNLMENLIHYNIGRFSDHETHLELPTRKDWLKIAIVMVFFAAMQGYLTYALTSAL